MVAVLSAALVLPAGAAASDALDRAVDALEQHPTDVLAAPLGDATPGDGRAQVLGYPLRNVARVAVDGQRGYVISNTALAVDGKPIDYALERDGDLAVPGAAPVDVEVSLATGTFALRAPKQPELHVRRLGAAKPDEAAIVSGRAVLAGTDTQTDSVVQVTADGVETYETLLGAGAPTTLRWQVDLPAGWALQTRPGNEVAVVDDRGKVAYLVTAPWARDARGAHVGVELVARADTVELRAAVDADTAFPVVIDPDWSSTYDFRAGSGSAGWFTIDQPVPGHPALGYTTQFATVGGFQGLWIWPTGSMTDQYVNVGGDGKEVRGGSRFEAPGSTRIKRVDFSQVIWELRQEDCTANPNVYRDVDQYLRFVLRNRDTDATTSERQIGGVGGLDDNRNVEHPSTVRLDDPSQQAPTSTSASLTMWTEARTTAAPKWIYPNPRPADADCDDKQSPFVHVGRVDVQLIDTDNPVIDEVSGEIKDWSQNAHTAWIGADPGTARQATGRVRMSDAGVGLDVGDGAGRRATTGVRATAQNQRSIFWDVSNGARCDAQHQTPALEGRLCPEAIDTSFTAANPLDLADLVGPNVPDAERDGPWDFRAEASDLVGHTAVHGGNWRYYVDTRAPDGTWVRIRDKDDVEDLTDRWIRAAAADEADGKKIRVSALATDPAVGGIMSGVRRVDMRWSKVGGGSLDLVPPGELTCSDATVASRQVFAPCPSSAGPDHATIPQHLASGQYVASATATDFAGNGPGPAAEATTWVDSDAPTVDFSGSLADLDGAWIAPSEAAALEVEAEDPGPYASGIAEATVRLTAADGTAVEPPTQLASCATRPGAPGAPAPPAPVCPTPTSGSLKVDTGAWPHGRVDVVVDATDAVGNRTPKADADVVVHVDRRPPSVVLSGELAEAASKDDWVVPHGDLGTRVHATDEGAGILRLEVWAKDEEGTRLVESRTVCNPPARTKGDTPPCPLDVIETFQIDPASVGDGTATFEVRAIEFTGRIARDRATVQLDGTPPPPVENLHVERLLGTAVASWDRPAQLPESSPIIGYEYAIIPAGETDVIYARTPSTSVPVPVMPFGEALDIYVCAIEASGNRSACSSVREEGPIAERESATAITVSQTLNTSSINGWIFNPKAFARNPRVKHFMKVSKATVASAIAWYLTDKLLKDFVENIKNAVAPPPSCSTLGSTAAQIDCYRPYGTAQESITEPLEGILKDVKAVVNNPGKLNDAFTTIGAAAWFQKNVMDVKTQQFMERALGPERNLGNSTDRMRVAYAEVAGRTIWQNVEVTGPLAAELWQDVVAANVKLAEKEIAESIDIAKGLGRIRLKRCSDAIAGEVIGKGARNHLVYWAPPSAREVLYVGMTKDWGRRCKSVRVRKKAQSKDPAEDPKRNAKTITDAVKNGGLPLWTYPLTKLEAKEVEEALIAHFGMRWAPEVGARGQLLNARHEFNRLDRDNYCRHLWRGQAILRANGYVALSTADPRFTAPALCS